MSKQTETGKAFEYACLSAIYNKLKDSQPIEIIENSALVTASNFYKELDEDKKNRMDIASRAAVNAIVRLEPQLENSFKNIPLLLNIQQDSMGIAGDVRDILCIRRQNDWEIGFSCKHNHFAVKHSRLSRLIDFGSKWFNKPCSSKYFEEINPIFKELEMMRSDKKLWRDVSDKDDRFYVPLLKSFIKELKRLDIQFPKEVPPAFIAYLLGRNDFYKVISKDSTKTTEIQAYNMFGTLNRSAGTIRPISKIPQLRLPSKIFDISFKENSKNTVIVTCDQGWAVSLRIHNASSKVEPSLKFDVNLIGTPNLGSIVEMWDM